MRDIGSSVDESAGQGTAALAPDSQHSAGKHTPGPWQASWIEVGGSFVEPFSGFLVWPAGQTSIQALMEMSAIASVWSEDDDDPVAEANALLIAASPRLLEAARLAVALIDREFRDERAAALEGHPMAVEARPAWDALCSAIAQAEHGQ